MANYHFEVKVISRGKGRSVTKLANYVSGKKLHDSYNGGVYSRQRQDVLFFKIFQPSHAPERFYGLQSLCDEIETAEKRYDARTARSITCSLPNELPPSELEAIVSDYVERNFTNYNLCAIAAIHEGRNIENPSLSNPHLHLVIPTREVSSSGFNPKKNREWDKKKYIKVLREDWAKTQNRFYEKNRLDVRVSSDSLEVQGEYDREPTKYLSRIDWKKIIERSSAHKHCRALILPHEIEKKREIGYRNR